ncbi:MAG TPA: hypothetical protein VF006_00895 [Longimicrobium sp.]
MIGNIVRNLTEGTRLEAPAPIPGEQVGVEQFRKLDAAFDVFAEQLKEHPFFQPSDPAKTPNASHSVTSFLCTRMARDLFGRGTAPPRADCAEAPPLPGNNGRSPRMRRRATAS